MTSTSLAYGRASGATAQGLFLAASARAPEGAPRFFVGDIVDPEPFSRYLLTLSRVVRSDFRPVPAGQLLDPVITTGRSALRFEGLSTCAGLYARADFAPEAFASTTWVHGTTHVDFGTHTRAALERLGRFSTPAALTVGLEEMTLVSEGQEAVEKKVQLSKRWIRGFCEAQVLQPRLEKRLETTGTSARRFLRALPRKVSAKRPMFILQAPDGGLRVATRPPLRGRAVAVHGIHRLRVIEALLEPTATLEVLQGPESEAARGASGAHPRTAPARLGARVGADPIGRAVVAVVGVKRDGVMTKEPPKLLLEEARVISKETIAGRLPGEHLVVALVLRPRALVDKADPKAFMKALHGPSRGPWRSRTPARRAR